MVNPSYKLQTRLGNDEIRILPRLDPQSESQLNLLTRCYSHQELLTSLREAGLESVDCFHADRYCTCQAPQGVFSGAARSPRLE